MGRSTPVPRPVLTGSRRTSLARRMSLDKVLAGLTLAPSALAVAIFVYGFIGWTGFVSLSNWRGVIPNYALAGLRNYVRLFEHQRFQTDLRNTVVFTAVFLTGSLFLGFVLAVLLDQGIRGEGLFRSIFLLPMAVSFVVTGVVWRWMLNPGTPETGYVGINLLLDRIGLGFLKSGWYTDPRIGIIAVALAAIWQMSGYVMALYLAGLRGIPVELWEAARVDGASELQIYRRIVIPLLRPITLGAVIVLGHISLKVFDLVAAMTGSGIGFSTDVPAYFMWDTTFRGNNFNQGAAIAVVLLAMVAVLIVPYLIFTMRSEAEV